ncbi:glutathione S-transferase family protein [Ramlibacter monticola]|uniref:Glutathione S-transferase N-terminal domain-containing protein n=1 Tax=Ramlibacter monticola TaxID=1926872 RepID=A0A936Z1L2_9BURK|nr:glutathione S-transferase N-terminal domain-containing protein [Ramlibacter monticola]MBL0391990.1 glutathione S-transferase N-terminal domain-containing protein [Ramlibacter monticola]
MALRLYYYPATAAMIPHILLEEIGQPYERVFVDRAADEHKGGAYLKLNPNGTLPVLADGDFVLYETAAIVLHLCDRFPQARLAPPAGTPERSHFHQWLAWLTNTLQATLMVYFYPERWVADGNAAGAAEVKARAQERVGPLLDQLDALVARHGGPWLLGDSYGALDPYVFTLCRWTRNFSAGKARERDHLGPYLQRMSERPAVQRVFAAEGLSAPFF